MKLLLFGDVDNLDIPNCLKINLNQPDSYYLFNESTGLIILSDRENLNHVSKLVKKFREINNEVPVLFIYQKSETESWLIKDEKNNYSRVVDLVINYDLTLFLRPMDKEKLLPLIQITFN